MPRGAPPGGSACGTRRPLTCPVLSGWSTIPPQMPVTIPPQMPVPGLRRSHHCTPTRTSWADMGSSMKASILTTLGGLPTVMVAIFHAQSGWSTDFARGQAEVAYWNPICVQRLAFNHDLQDLHHQDVFVGCHEDLWEVGMDHKA